MIRPMTLLIALVFSPLVSTAIAVRFRDLDWLLSIASYFRIGSIVKLPTNGGQSDQAIVEASKTSGAT